MPPLKKNEKLMLAGIGVMVVVFVAMDPYYFIYRDPPETTSEEPAKGAKTGGEKAKVDNAKAEKAPAKQAKSNHGSKHEQAAEPAPDNRPKREPVVFNSWGRDPFVQTKQTIDDAQAVSGLKLSGISVKGDDSYALINKQIVRTGDAIEGMIVSRIEADRVMLSKGGQTYTLMGGRR